MQNWKTQANQAENSRRQSEAAQFRPGDGMLGLLLPGKKARLGQIGIATTLEVDTISCTV